MKLVNKLTRFILQLMMFQNRAQTPGIPVVNVAKLHYERIQILYSTGESHEFSTEVLVSIFWH